MSGVLDVLGLVKPTWRGRIHSWAFALSVPAAIALLAVADGAAARITAAIYGVSLAAVFGTSAAYHRLARTATAIRRLRRLDHAMIYVLIAGTYTPVCVLALPDRWGVPLLALAWTGAVAGIVLKLVGFDRFARVGNALYLLLGWAVLLAVPAMVAHLRPWSFAFMAIGGLAYTVGAVILFTRRPNPLPAVFGFHEVWHACTVVAAAAHFAMVWRIVAV